MPAPCFGGRVKHRSGGLKVTGSSWSARDVGFCLLSSASVAIIPPSHHSNTQLPLVPIYHSSNHNVVRQRSLVGQAAPTRRPYQPLLPKQSSSRHGSQLWAGP